MSPVNWSIIGKEEQETHTCPSFSASLSEYWLGEARFASIPEVMSVLSSPFFTIYAPILIGSELGSDLRSDLGRDLGSHNRIQSNT